jgi:pimeloyl-ACP methyl ester carboxylesterase
VTIRDLRGRLAKDGSSRGIVMIGGWTASVDFWAGEMAGQEGGITISQGVVKETGRLTCSLAENSSWGNSAQLTRITTVVDACQSRGYFPSGTVNLFGNSAGCLSVLKWALANPTRVNAIGLALPASDLQSLYDRNPISGVTTSIAAAYGGARPLDADNPHLSADDLAGIPMRLWRAEDDDVVPAVEVDELAAATGAEIVELGPVGHSWGDESIFNGSAVAAYFTAADA